MGKKWSEVVSESPAGPLSGTELVVAVQGGQTVGLDYDTLKSWLQFKNNLSATTDPGANDDSTAGYEAGSKWLNTNTSEWFICSVATAGAAVWEPLSLSADDLGSMAVVDDAASDGTPYARQDGGWQPLGSASLKDVGVGGGELAERTVEGLVVGPGRVFVFTPTINDDSVYQIDIASGFPAKITVLYHLNAADALVRSFNGNDALTYTDIYAQTGTEIEAGPNGTYTGTTGTDGKMTFAAESGGPSGRFYIENRVGGPRGILVIVWGKA